MSKKVLCLTGELHLKLNQKEQGAKVYEELIERNSDNILYYKKLEECLSLSRKLLTARHHHRLKLDVLIMAFVS